MSFAGSAAGGSLSSMYWNPAAAGEVGKGLSFYSSYTLVLPDSTVTADSVTGGPNVPVAPGVAAPLGAVLTGLGKDKEVDIGQDAIVPASYAAYRGDIDPNFVFALSLNSQYGLSTKPDNSDWIGQFHARSAKVFSLDVEPTVAYKVARGITVGAGVNFQYFELTGFKSASTLDGPSADIEGHDLALGYTAGILFEPLAGTKIGVGYRSSVGHELNGTVSIPTTPFSSAVHADLETPDKVTFSVEQALSSKLRATGTVEWTNWSRLGVIPVVLDQAFPPTGQPAGQSVANLDFQWHDGWFFALGGEYDWSPNLTLRAGGAYEISPIQNASERLIQLPDANRTWLSVGASYKWSEMFTVDFAYSHIFVEDADISRVPASPALSTLLFTGSAESSVDILSVGLKSHW